VAGREHEDAVLGRHGEGFTRLDRVEQHCEGETGNGLPVEGDRIASAGLDIDHAGRRSVHGEDPGARPGVLEAEPRWRGDHDVTAVRRALLESCGHITLLKVGAPGWCGLEASREIGERRLAGGDGGDGDKDQHGLSA
jgi:hypothetical protein